MGNQLFDEEAHAAATAKILAKVPALRAELKQLDSHMQTLFASWKGRASQSHQRVQLEWTQQHTQLNEALQRFLEHASIEVVRELLGLREEAPSEEQPSAELAEVHDLRSRRER